jgi:hypothetical protein
MNITPVSTRHRHGLVRDCVLSLHTDSLIAASDPFHVNGVLPQLLPRWNADADVAALTAVAARLVGQLHPMTHRDVVTSAACMRDLGFMAASLVRHDVRLDAVAGLEAALLTLGLETDEVPRDTVYSYATRNPADDRQRMFTELPEERMFIEAVTESMRALARVIEQLDLAGNTDFGTDEFVHHAEQAAVHMRRMVREIRTVIRNLTPETFTFGLRPYFPPLTVGSRVYFGPGGAQMAMLIVDVMLFGLDWSSGPELESYVRENLAYLPPVYRRLADAHLRSTSLLASWLGQARQHHATGVRPERIRESLDATKSVIKAMLRFRYPHENLAKANFLLRPPAARGSGGYQVDALTMLLDQTNRAHADVLAVRDAVGRD